MCADVNRELTAPRYEPACAFHPPVPAPFEAGLDSFSIGELLDTPATQALLLTYTPWALRMAQSEHFKPFRSTFTLRDMAFFIPLDTAAALAAIDTALRQLPPSEWPHVG